MTKVIRLTEQTIKLLELYRENLINEMKSDKIDMTSILKKDDLLIQCALNTALQYYY